MLEDLRSILRELCRLEGDKPVLVGVSGGPDSMCLLDVLMKCGYSVIIAHLNHALRPEADQDAIHVERYARKLGVKYIMEKADVAAIAAQEHLAIEQAARDVRYRFLFEQARAFDAQAVAVGHTADDQVETVLMHLLQGTGMNGLKGMHYRTQPNPWDSTIPLVRPLLGVWRTQILEWIASSGIDAVHDKSNLDLSFFRNRLRHELIPMLNRYNPRADHAIWRMANNLQAEYQIIEWLLDDVWIKCFQGEGAGYQSFDANEVSKYPLAVQYHLMRKALIRVNLDMREVDYELINRSMQLIWESGQANRVGLVGGYSLLLEGDRLWLVHKGAELPFSDWPQVPESQPGILSVPGSLPLGEGWVLSATNISIDSALLDEIEHNTDQGQAWITIDGYQLPLLVQRRKPGDRFAPIGMGGKQVMISDYMINTKIPKRARGGWPLVCAVRRDSETEEIVWVTGYRQCEASRVSTLSEQVVFLNLYRCVQPQ